MPRPSLRVLRFRHVLLAVSVSLLAGPAAADWPSNPLGNLVICNASNFQLSPDIATDRAGGAIIAWADLRNGVSYDIYAQHVLASGTVDPAWLNGGRAVCTAAGSQGNVKLVSDGWPRSARA